jgi:hypothetical protein
LADLSAAQPVDHFVAPDKTGSGCVGSGSFPCKKLPILSAKLGPGGTRTLRAGGCGHSGGGAGGALAQALKVKAQAIGNSAKGFVLRS